jgi:hypothetical protein
MKLVKRIYKVGSVTRLRSGRYVEDSHLFVFNNGRITLMIEWDKYDHFADNGDCGSIYFYKYKK